MSDRFSYRRFLPPLIEFLAALPWLLCLAFLIRGSWFICDDAYISFRYADNLVHGEGLVFNHSERVEGYTNFLWVLELAGIWKIFGFRPESSANVLSLAYTLGTLLACRWLIPADISRRGCAIIGWMTLGILCSSPTFAIWSTSGLETRQFTFFVVLGLALMRRQDRQGRFDPRLSGLALAAAELTRPEGLMLGAIAAAWIVVDAHQLNRETFRRLARFSIPFGSLVGLHFVGRRLYYGDWLPNTYYAKHVRAWYEAGFSYLTAVSLETGLYLLFLIAAGVAHASFKKRKAGNIAALGCIWVLVHALYLMRVGGDHFEWRPLDFYWPILASLAATGIYLGAHSFVAHASRGRVLRPAATLAGALSYCVVLAYCSAPQLAIFRVAAPLKTRAETRWLEVPLENKSLGLLGHLPGMTLITALSTDLRSRLVPQSVGLRFAEHRSFGADRISLWGDYRDTGLREVFPNDAVSSMKAMGIVPYHLPGLQIIDELGLTDSVVAHNPVLRPNHERVIAHDRRPPPGYLQQRGVNIYVHPPAHDRNRALAAGDYAVRLHSDLWMPVTVKDHLWFDQAFGHLDVERSAQFSNRSPDENWVQIGDSQSIGTRFLGRFEDGESDGWQIEPDGVFIMQSGQIHGLQAPVFGHVGPGYLNSYHPQLGDVATGTARSPVFFVESNDWLSLRVGGGASSELAVRLIVDGKIKRVWRGRDDEQMREVHVRVGHYAGRALFIELEDNARGGWGHIMLDHVMLIRPASVAQQVAHDSDPRTTDDSDHRTDFGTDSLSEPMSGIQVMFSCQTPSTQNQRTRIPPRRGSIPALT